MYPGCGCDRRQREITMGMAMAGAAKDIHQEQPVRTYSGFVALAIGIALLVLAGWLVNDIFANVRARVPISFATLAATVAVAIAAVLVLLGLYTLQPNEAAIIQLFGAYRGTTRTPGLRATNPFYTRKKLSLRARNLNGERLKVNDKRCLLYTSDAADERSSVDLGGRRII